MEKIERSKDDLASPLTPKEAIEALARFETIGKRLMKAKPMPQKKKPQK